MPPPRALLGLLALLLIAMVISGCGGGEAGSGSAEASEDPAVPEFCADEDAREQTNLFFQLLPQVAASPDAGTSRLESAPFTGLDFDAIGRHIDAVESAPASGRDAGGEVKSRYVEAMRDGVDAYQSAKEGDASKLATASPAMTDAYLAFATPYACS